MIKPNFGCVTWVLKFFALRVVSEMGERLRRAGIRMSWREAADRLQKVKAVHIRFADGSEGWVRTEASDEETLQLMRLFGVPTSRVVLSMEEKKKP